jgi:NAD(P)H-hydrate epimerase
MTRLTRKQVRWIDRLSVEIYKIPGVVLMENAARAAADVASEMLALKRGQVLLFCGGGNNGGDGLAVARHLHNRGIEISILPTADPAKYQGEALTNWEIVQAMKLPVVRLGQENPGSNLPEFFLRNVTLIVDAIFGTGLTTPPRPPFPEIVETLNHSNIPILSIDLPSGLDCDTGLPLGSCIRATRTITFVAEKIGFANPAAAQFLGTVSIGDIGCPRELITGELIP